MSKPLEVGCANDVVAVIHCDRHALEWIVAELPQGDGFTKDLWAALDQIDREAEQERADIEEFGRPALDIGFDRNGPFFHCYRSYEATQ